MLDTVEPDDGCCKALIKALLKAETPMDSWTCPKCGVEWAPRIVGDLRHWEAVCPVVVFRP